MFFKLKIINKAKFFNLRLLIISLLLICSQFEFTHCLYEDQIGKFDWKQSFIGKLKDAHFDPQSIDRIIATTDKNVLAALNAKTGEILWRKAFEKCIKGDIKLLHIQPVDNNRNNLNDESVVITVNGNNPALIRGWSPITGNLHWEWSVMSYSLQNGNQPLWFYDDSLIYQVTPSYESQYVELTSYVASTGQQIRPSSKKIPTPWITNNNCVLATPYFACIFQKQIVAIDLTADNSEIIKTSLNEDNENMKIQLVKGSRGTIAIGNKIVSLSNVNTPINSKASNTIFIENINNKAILLSASIKEKNIHIQSQLLNTGENTRDLDIVSTYPDSLGTPTIIDVKCRSKVNDQSATCRILFSTEDGGIVLMQQGKFKWIREEALADIVAIEMIDLPLSDSEGAIENELKNKDGDIIGALIRRISTQIIHIRNLVLTIFGLGAPPSASQKAGLVRDAFGLHKMIVAVSATGKIFGIDNISGKYHWITYLEHFTGFNNGENIKILIQRTSRHFPYPAQCAIIGKNKNNGNGIIYQFNPISGQPINDGITFLNYEIRQVMLLHLTDADFCKGILLFDNHQKVQVIPESSAQMAHGLYLYMANKSTGIVSGYYTEYVSNSLKATPIWQINLSSADNTQKITNLASKNPNEHVHSQGRVLSDRSVLYKYINPNLVAVATQGPDPIHKYILNVHLIDVVSGNIVSSMTHRKAKDPVYMVHSENWLVYSYYNEKLRRTEITTVELYEGKTQTNSTVWSSLDAPPLPMVERQSYIIPANVVALKETITEKGITNKHVLIGLSNGGIIEMPWAFLDPRRPSLNYNQAREEGIIPYIPELQLASENIINYNQSIANIKGIYTAPSGLESTSLVVAYGLDLFVTRLAPSKTFDLLKEDFDYILISAVLAGLTIASCVVKHLSSRKAIKQAWK